VEEQQQLEQVVLLLQLFQEQVELEQQQVYQDHQPLILEVAEAVEIQGKAIPRVLEELAEVELVEDLQVKQVLMAQLTQAVAQVEEKVALLMVP
tara:strand:- start:202 stop:483 length:282 start_codon:yes stop_codon:yes gene_type:complete